MSSEQNRREGALFIRHVPQVFIDVVEGIDVEINVSSIGSDFSVVDIDSIKFPIELALQIGEALVRISKGEIDGTR